MKAGIAKGARASQARRIVAGQAFGHSGRGGKRNTTGFTGGSPVGDGRAAKAAVACASVAGAILAAGRAQPTRGRGARVFYAAGSQCDCEHKQSLHSCVWARAEGLRTDTGQHVCPLR